jgi:proteasome lid subunit RPN8/RPN11
VIEVHRIRLSPEQLQLMLEHVAEVEPMEACGLLGGSQSKVDEIVPIRNAAESRVRFLMDPAEQIEALFSFEERGLELVAIYHSHPAGPSGPSQIDISEAAYPEAVQLIWFLEEGVWVCRAYRYEDRGAVELPIAIVSGENEDGSKDD